MNKKIVLILMSLIMWYLHSQSLIEAPFISNLNFEVTNNKVLLTWKNPANFDQYLSIYRSNSIIDNIDKILKSKKISILKSQEEKYLDTPQQDGMYYYAVIITDKNSQKETLIFVPYRNYTLKPAEITTKSIFTLTSLKALSKESYVILSWEYQGKEEENTKISIYRAIKQIDSENSLNLSTKIATIDIKNRSYVDIPLPDIGYYYAIFIEDDKDRKFIPAVNITTDPIVIYSKNIALNEFSLETFQPLPLLTIKEDPITGSPIDSPQTSVFPLKIQYNERVKKIIEEDKKTNKDIFKTFENELEKSKEMLPVKILNNEDAFEPTEFKNEYKNVIDLIKKQQYDSAQKILEDIINYMLPESLLARVSYYLGLIYYIKGELNLSFIYLNYSYNSFKTDIEPYLNSIYVILFDKLER